MFFLQNRRSLCRFLQKDQQKRQYSCNQEESKRIKGLYPVFKENTKEAHGLANDSITNFDSSKLVYINGKSSITAFKNIDLNLNSQRNFDQIGEHQVEASGVVKSLILKNNFSALHEVTEEELLESDDSSLDKEFVDATQISEDDSDSIENSHVININKNKKFLHDFGRLW